MHPFIYMYFFEMLILHPSKSSMYILYFNGTEYLKGVEIRNI